MLILKDNSTIIFDYQSAIDGATDSEVEFLKEEQQELEKVIINSDLDEESKQSILDITNSFYDNRKDKIDIGWVVDEDLDLTITDLNELVSGGVVISGSIGAWNGRHSIENVDDLTLRQAIKKVISGDYYNFLLVREDNDLKIYCIHHDNYNEFLIKREDGNSIFKKGDEFYEFKESNGN
jgi:hypothetical protein